MNNQSLLTLVLIVVALSVLPLGFSTGLPLWFTLTVIGSIVAVAVLSHTYPKLMGKKLEASPS